jgi:hypothetical protein
MRCVPVWRSVAAALAVPKWTMPNATMLAINRRQFRMCILRQTPFINVASLEGESGM